MEYNNEERSCFLFREKESNCVQDIRNWCAAFNVECIKTFTS